MSDTRPAKVAQVAFELRGMRFVSGTGPDHYPALFDAALVLRGPFFGNAGPNKRPDEAASRGAGTLLFNRHRLKQAGSASTAPSTRPCSSLASVGKSA